MTKISSLPSSRPITGDLNGIIAVYGLMRGQIVVCLVTLRRKEMQEWWREYWWVSRSLMTARKITLVLWVLTWKRTVTDDRAGSKHLTLKFQGPVGLGGMNKGLKNTLLKEHWPKGWMCSSHAVMVCYCCWNHQEESVKKRVGLFCLKNMWGKKGQKNVTPLFILPGGSHPGRIVWMILIGQNK